MARNTITVKKPKDHRIFIGVFSILAIGIVTLCAICFDTPIAFLLYVPLLPILLPLVIVYFTWELRFEREQIVNILCFRKVKIYPYAQLCEVTQQYFTSEHGYCIRMDFTDGKIIRFRMDDDGAAQAVKFLIKHHSIKTK